MIKKVKKDFWEEIFVYPSFNIRFGTILTLAIFLFVFFLYIFLFQIKLAENVSDQLSIINLMVQSATLFLGIFAAYYALRQLVETRFTNLDEMGMREMKSQRYSRAFNKWKEAFYIRPDPSVFANLCEVLLLIGDYDTFDEYMIMSEKRTSLRKGLLQEVSDQIVVLYLKSMRNLFVKNQGEAEKNLSELVTLVANENGLQGFQWDFIDLQTSLVFQELSGECRLIAENLIAYLSKTMSLTRKGQFEKKDFATQIA